MSHRTFVSQRWCVCFFITALTPLLCPALTADDLLLITNKNVAASLKLAESYADARHVPAGRIVELDLPTTEQLTFDEYETRVVPPVRGFLQKNHLESRVSCLVTFYGVPIRIAARINTPGDRMERAAIEKELATLPAQAEPMVIVVEDLVRSVLPAYTPAQKGKKDLDSLTRRAESALQELAKHARTVTDSNARMALVDQTSEAIAPMLGPIGRVERTINVARAAAAAGVKADIPTTQQMTKLVSFRNELRDLIARRFDPAAREQLRTLIRENLGPFEFGRLLQNQLSYLETDNTTAALDNELALFWDDYPRRGWLGNPLHYAATSELRGLRALMVCRLDGPQSGTVQQIIVTSVKAETDGLAGKVVIDSRGLPPEKNGKPDAYGIYDQTMRNLAELLQAKGKHVSLVLDDEEPVMRAGSVEEVAVYCGWYSVNQYIPACRFNPGAVAFHLASFTMETLRLEDPRSWCRGLLLDGAAVTFGPVAEPYLHAFPRADDFFPLLFTGKLTLAEVYWKTTPLTSWMITLIGDPLYTPYKNNPVLQVESLPPRLQAIFAPPATVPSK